MGCHLHEKCSRPNRKIYNCKELNP
jgi:hypothetical protein